ncbi:MAG: hypothetical protein MR894_03260 [Akkermansia muciniphila]|nr:hypothetical protein [Akkermansia muciniphila]
MEGLIDIKHLKKSEPRLSVVTFLMGGMSDKGISATFHIDSGVEADVAGGLDK